MIGIRREIAKTIEIEVRSTQNSIQEWNRGKASSCEGKLVFDREGEKTGA